MCNTPRAQKESSFDFFKVSLFTTTMSSLHAHVLYVLEENSSVYSVQLAHVREFASALQLSYFTRASPFPDLKHIFGVLYLFPRVFTTFFFFLFISSSSSARK